MPSRLPALYTPDCKYRQDYNNVNLAQTWCIVFNYSTYKDTTFSLLCFPSLLFTPDPWGIALDITNRIIYYSDYTYDGVSSLSMADFGSGTATPIPNTNEDKPRQIAYGAETT